MNEYIDFAEIYSCEAHFVKDREKRMSRAAVQVSAPRAATEERNWERFRVRRPARLIAVRPCLAGMSIRSCQITDISQGGAGFSVHTTIGLPDHYYLNILGLLTRVGCAEVYRNGNRVGVKFIDILDEETVRSIVRADFAGAAK